MNVALVSYGDDGGAGRAATRLLDALVQAGIDAVMLTERKTTANPRVQAPSGLGRRYRDLRAGFDRAAVRVQRTTNPAWHSAAVLPGGMYGRIERASPDVLNLHWLGDSLSVAQIGRLKGPVVWTLHDLWALCGAEHLGSVASDARWRTGYRQDNRPSGAGLADIDRWTWARKRRHWRRAFHLVTPSQWLAGLARDSALLSSWPVSVVPNALPLGVFAPDSSAAARAEFGIPAGDEVVMFAAHGGTGIRAKGWHLLEPALARLSPGRPRLRVVVVGELEPSDPPRVGVPVTWVGPVSEDRLLARLYVAADVVVVPSLQENLPQTATEAQACGTPVVGFRTAGLPEAVEHGRTGYLAEPFSVDSLAATIERVLVDGAHRSELGRAARERAERLWEPSAIAARYAEVYETARRMQSGRHGRP